MLALGLLMWTLARYRTSSFFAFSFAGAIEVGQLSVSGRHARLSDFIVDAFAACIGFLASCVVAQKLETAFDPDFRRHPADD